MSAAAEPPRRQPSRPSVSGEQLPPITFPPELPVSQRREEIAKAISEHQVLILAGETGSGKTTQLPKICLELGRTSIAHTQPRRIAARTVAERIAAELGSELGELVGYQVRFTDESSDATRIKLMTDGILLNAIHRDRELRRYDTIIIDEAHERSLNIDFLLGYLQRLLPRRPDLKVIITSATIDPESFARHFDEAPIIEVSGRTHPVELRYRPLAADRFDTDDEDDLDSAPKADSPPASPRAEVRRSGVRSPSPSPQNAAAAADHDVFEGIVDALDELEREEAGDVLVFLPGEQEIRDAQEAIGQHLSRRRLQDTEVLPLYGRLSAAEQHRIFDTRRPPGIRRRVVLATNVAETSLTVPGIAYVIDAGTARISRYSTRAHVQRLPIEPISQASANQRSGRSGRTRPGIAIRLYSETDFQSRPEFTEPEILRTGLASVLLQMLQLDLGAVEEFPFLQPPDPRGIKDGIELLLELGAISRIAARGRAPYRLTRLGRDLARLPIDPRYGRMVLASRDADVTREVLVIVAGLSVQDVRERPAERRGRADELHARFRDPTSDFLSLLNLWDYLEQRSAELGSSAFRRLCRDEFINFIRFREWQDVVRQLRQLVAPLGLKVRRQQPSAPAPTDRPVEETGAARAPRAAAASAAAKTATGRLEAADAQPWRRPDGHAKGDAIHRALLSGLLSHLGIYNRVTREYQGARGTKFAIFPGSGLAKTPPDAVMAAELVETSRLFARTVARIDPAWAEELAGPLARRRHSAPHWERKAGQAVALETVTLYGVTLIEGRKANYAAIDPEHSRELFIRHALVEGDWDGTHHAFERRNRALRRELAQIEERARRRDLIGDDDAVYDFFQERIPAEVVSTPSFERWWRAAREREPQLLTLSREVLLGEEAQALGEDRAAFPPYWQQGDQRLKLRYRFEPGAPDDGVTALVPLPLLARVDASGFDWQVPGFREELVTALLRSLPKLIRRNFVPAADWAAKLVGDLGPVEPHTGSTAPAGLVTALRDQLQRAAGIRFEESEFDLTKVPSHLRMRFRVLDERGRELDSGEDLPALQLRLKRLSEASLSRVAAQEFGERAVGAGAGTTAAGLDRVAPRGAAPRGAGSGSAGSADGAPVNATGTLGRARSGAAAAAGSTAEVSGAEGFERQGITAWPLDAIPPHLDIHRKVGVIRAFPTLRLGPKGRIDLAVVTTSADQAREHPRAVRALLAASVPSPAGYVQEHLTGREKLALAASPYPSVGRLLADIVLALADEALAAHDQGLVLQRGEFERLRDAVNGRLVDAMFDTAKLVAEILELSRGAGASLKAANHRALLPSIADARSQLDALVFDGFISRTGTAQLRHLLRYLRALQHRLDRMAESPALERAGLPEIQQAIELYSAAGGVLPLAEHASPQLIRARWQLEEFRVSLFAQQLGTAQPVSLKRIRQTLDS